MACRSMAGRCGDRLGKAGGDLRVRFGQGTADHVRARQARRGQFRRGVERRGLSSLGFGLAGIARLGPAEIVAAWQIKAGSAGASHSAVRQVTARPAWLGEGRRGLSCQVRA